MNTTNVDSFIEMNTLSINESSYESFSSGNKIDNEQFLREHNKYMIKNLTKTTISEEKSFDESNSNNESKNVPQKERKKSIFVVTRNVDAPIIEEALRLDYFKSFKRAFTEDADKRSNLIDFHRSYRRENDIGLTKKEFVELFSEMFFDSFKYQTQLERLFDKLNVRETGKVTWNDFCNYMLSYYREKEYLASMKLLPFNNAPQIQHVPHNRLAVTVKLMHLNNPVKFLNVSRRGVIGIWNKNLRLERKFRIDQESEDKSNFAHKNSRQKIFTWVTDAVVLPNVHKIIIATSGRELRFFSVSSEHCFEDYFIYGMPNVPTCLHYWYDVTEKQTYSLLHFGDDTGNVHVFRFLNPRDALFDPLHKQVKGTTKIYWNDIKLHNNFVSQSVIKTVHNESIRRIIYLQQSNTLISCSTDAKTPLAIHDLNEKMKTYIFRMSKGCVCFDYSKISNILVTGSSDSYIRIWDPYMESKPVAVLSGHKSGVIDVTIHQYFGYLYSYSADGVVKVWDLDDFELLQQVSLHFPSIIHGKTPEFGPFSMHLYHEENSDQVFQFGSLMLACDDYVGFLEIGENEKKNRINKVFGLITTHNGQISAMVYSELLKEVVTASYDSTISFWNAETGHKIVTVKDAHGTSEVTCLALDKSQRRVFSGARDGTVKAWNIVNGLNVQNFAAANNAEITGISFVEKRKAILCVGWNRRVVSYPDELHEELIIKPQNFGLLLHKHKEDILCSDLCLNTLATGSYDGEIKVWNANSEKLLLTLNRKQNNLHVRFRELTSASSQVSQSNQSQQCNNEPIDALLFLKHRVNKYGLRVGVLVSSQSGSLSFWSLYAEHAEQGCIGSFYACNQQIEFVRCLSSDPVNQILISGDTNGFVYVWDIEKYLLFPNDNPNNPPKCICSWKAHNGTIVSCQYVKYERSNDSLELVLTGSSDFCCKLWTLNGKLIGVFGQSKVWNLNAVRDFQSNSFETEKSNNSINDSERRTSATKSVKLPPILNDTENESQISRIKSVSNLDTSLKTSINKSDIPKTQTTSKFDYLSSIKYFKCRQKPYDIGPKSKISLDLFEQECKNQNDLKDERRNTYSKIDRSLLFRLNNASCTPYVSLKLMDHDLRKNTTANE